MWLKADIPVSHNNYGEGTGLGGVVLANVTTEIGIRSIHDILAYISDLSGTSWPHPSVHY